MEHGVYITLEEQNQKLFLEDGESFFHMLVREKLFDVANCGGRGTCGRCRIQFLDNAPVPKPAERRFFSPEELRGGYRLACLSKPVKDCRVCLAFEKERENFVLDAMPDEVQSVLKAGKEKETGIASASEEMIVADLGTTTIVMQLVEVSHGTVIKSFHAMNPQRKYGADVVSRIKAAMDGAADELKKLVEETILQGIRALGGNPRRMFLAGNTTMIHLLMGYSIEGLSKEPFLPVTTAEIHTGFGEIDTLILPGFSAFVGGDIYAGLYAMAKIAKCSQNAAENQLFIDLGTNGEMALVTPDKTFVTATAAGPAFEGGATAQVFGADMVRITANLLDRGVIDSYGTMEEPYFSTGILMEDVVIKQEDIRSLQLAKAAVRGGIEVLLEKSGLEESDIETVYLAGGFGYKLDCIQAGRIGLLPENMVAKTVSVGNTSLAGAFLYGRDVLSGLGEKTEKLVLEAESINLARVESFTERYVAQINFS